MTMALETPLTQESRIAKWAHDNASSHDAHYVAPTDRIVPVLFTPLVALTVAGAVGCALGPATSFATAFGYHEGTTPAYPGGGSATGRSIDELTSSHPGMA